ncbi:MAG: S46 family peptidase [Gemmataceae bacterium]
MTATSDEGVLAQHRPFCCAKKYGFTLTDEWLKRAMLASVRLNSGGSGGFKSLPRRVARHQPSCRSRFVQKLGKAGTDMLADGFYAPTRDKELKCPDLEINVLQSIEDVTKDVNAVVKPEMTPGAAAIARRAVMADIEKKSLDATGLRSDVVTLYNGGQYHLYRYKKFTDVRLVFAPESGIAAFGGDVDNFEYPRHGLDVAFFRAYENGEPAKTPHFFKWNTEGPKENDLAFVTGHPGVTQRLETLAKLKHRRDVTLPYTLARLRALEAALNQFSEQSPEKKRQAATDLHSAANARKAFSGQYQGLLDPVILNQKKKLERDLLDSAYTQRHMARMGEGFQPPSRLEGPDRIQDATETIAAIQGRFAKFEKEWNLFETGHAFSSPLFGIARHCVRMAEELPKKSPERLREYRDSNLDSLKFGLFSPAPLYPELERTKLQTSLTFLAEQLGGEHELVKLSLAGKNPAQRAQELVAGTTLFDPEVRKKYVAEPGTIASSTDPLIVLARAIDAESRKLRIRYETEVEEPERQAYAVLAEQRFANFGNTQAPDATFTLRLAFGTVKGYEVGGEKLPFHTTFGSAFQRHADLGGKEPFALPKRWTEGQSKLDLATPFSFVSTADTIGRRLGQPGAGPPRAN